MTPDRTQALRLRQQALLARSAGLRADLASELSRWRPAFGWADQARAGLAWLRQHPEWPVGAVVLIVLLRPRRALGWGLRLWSAWRVLLRVRGALAKALPAAGPPPR